MGDDPLEHLSELQRKALPGLVQAHLNRWRRAVEIERARAMKWDDVLALDREVEAALFAFALRNLVRALPTLPPERSVSPRSPRR
jgi:hypothetical protein